MNASRSFTNLGGPVLAGVLLLCVLYLASRSGYLLFHSLAEVFAIVISAAVFTLTWNTRHFTNQGYQLFVGTALLAGSALNILHALSYPGISIFPDYGANLPTQLWLARRYLEGISLLIAPLFLTRRLHAGWTVTGFAAVTGLLIWAIFAGVFPVAYVDGVGLTPFKVISEYVVAALLLAAAVWVYLERRRFDPGTARLLIASLVISAAAGILFTLYVGVYELPNRLGHVLFVAAYFLIYRAIVQSGLIKPYTLLAEANVALSQREAALSQHKAVLLQTTERLQAEVAAREAAQAVLARQRAELQVLARHLVEVQEGQSAALSREIHDTSAQALAAIKMGLLMLKRKAQNTDAMLPPERVASTADELGRMVDTVVEDLHRLSVNLRPSSLDQHGLMSAVEQLLAALGKQAGLDIRFTARGLEQRLPDDVETALYRIVQEATTNIIRHAGARQVAVDIERVGPVVRLAVTDDGCGFDVDAALSRGRLGLLGMRERAELLGGTFAIVSGPDRGATVRVEAPVVGH